jgi:Ca2+-binding EF-hand superfamily protein
MKLARCLAAAVVSGAPLAFFCAALGCNCGVSTPPATGASSPPATTVAATPDATAPVPDPPPAKTDSAVAAATDSPDSVPAEAPTDEAIGDAASKSPDPDKPVDERPAERLVLFLPGGPLVVELEMTIDGQPFRAARDELIDHALKLADRDGDGQATWSEVMSDPKRVFMQRYDLSLNGSNRKEFLRAHDTNQNGLIDRDEARRVVARAKSAGTAFSLESASEYRHSNHRQSIVRSMLDINDDDRIDEAELAAIEERLLCRDADDDHTLTWSELDDSLAGDEQAMMASQNAYLNQPAALMLGDHADWDGIVYGLTERYLRYGRPLDESFPLTPALAAALDEDGNDDLTYEEVRRLNVVEPHLLLAANFGKPGDKVAGVSVLSLSSELGQADRVVQHTPRGLLLVLDGYRLQVVLDDRAPDETGGPSAEEQLASLDKDKNGYLEKEEISDVSPDVARMFEEADANGDGKVYLDELEAYRRLQRAPQLSAIRAVAGDDQDVLFPLLDANRDGRLTARELRDGAKALLALDADRDGQISLEELPDGMTLLLARGLPSNMTPRRNLFAPLPEPAAASGPAWFVHMDANRDQEVSLDEFPGSPEKFRSLDLNGDGFLSPSEGAVAGGAGDEKPPSPLPPREG